jgi:hypothetical protein
MHALNHAFNPLVLLCDINEILRSEKDSIDWNRLIDEAFAFNLSKHVYYVLYLLSKMFNAQIPGRVMDLLKPEKMGLIEHTFLSSVLRGSPILTGEWLLLFGMNDTVRDRFLFLWRLIFPPRKELALIRKSDVSSIGVRDYFKRLRAGLSCVTKVMFHFSKQATFKL